MKTADVQVGQVYLCRVGETLRRVIVITRLPGDMRASGRRGPDVFRVRRVDTNSDLPKARHATALRPCPEVPSSVVTIDARSAYPICLTHEPYEDKVAKHLDTETPTLPHEPVIIEDAYDRIDSNALRNDLGIFPTTQPQPPTVPPTEPNPVQTGVIVSQEYYLSAAENHIGWCTTCKAFRGENLEPDSRECICPDCHQPTLYDAELALTAGLISPQEDE